MLGGEGSQRGGGKGEGSTLCQTEPCTHMKVETWGGGIVILCKLYCFMTPRHPTPHALPPPPHTHTNTHTTSLPHFHTLPAAPGHR